MNAVAKPASAASASVTSGKTGCWCVRSTQNVFSACAACGLTVSATNSPPGRSAFAACGEQPQQSLARQVLDHLHRDDAPSDPAGCASRWATPSPTTTSSPRSAARAAIPASRSTPRASIPASRSTSRARRGRSRHRAPDRGPRAGRRRAPSVRALARASRGRRPRTPGRPRRRHGRAGGVAVAEHASRHRVLEGLERVAGHERDRTRRGHELVEVTPHRSLLEDPDGAGPRSRTADLEGVEAGVAQRGAPALALPGRPLGVQLDRQPAKAPRRAVSSSARCGGRVRLQARGRPRGAPRRAPRSACAAGEIEAAGGPASSGCGNGAAPWGCSAPQRRDPHQPLARPGADRLRAERRRDVRGRSRAPRSRAPAWSVKTSRISVAACSSRGSAQCASAG